MNVKIHDKQGKVICKISLQNRREYPSNIEECVWNMAEGIANEQERRIRVMSEVMGGEIMASEGKETEWNFLVPGNFRGDYLCPICLNLSIQPMRRMWLGLFVGKEFAGYACLNEECLMHNVTIPKILVQKIGRDHATLG